MTTRLPTALLRRSDGLAMIELAILLPFLLLLLAGAVEIGRMVHHHQVVETAARTAARFLSRTPFDGGATATTCGGEAFGTVNAARARNLAMYGRISATGSAVITYWPAAGANTICISTRMAGSVRVVAVEVTLPYSDAGILNFTGIDAVDLSARHEERWIGE